MVKFMKTRPSFWKKYILVAALSFVFFAFGSTAVEAKCVAKGDAGTFCSGFPNIECANPSDPSVIKYCTVDIANNCQFKNEIVPATFCSAITDEPACKLEPICTYEPDTATPPTATVSKPTKTDKNAPKIVSLINPIAGNPDIQTIIGNVILKAMGVLGALALLVFVYGGFKWLSAAGREESIKEGTQAMLWAVIGIFIIFGSYAIIKLIYTGLGVDSDTVMTKIPASIEEKNGCFCKIKDYAEGVELQMPDNAKYNVASSCVNAVGTPDDENNGTLAECTWYEGNQPFASSNKSKIK